MLFRSCEGALSALVVLSFFALKCAHTQVIQLNSSGRPSTLLSLNPAPPVPADPTTKGPGAFPTADETAAKTFAITSVAWAPSCGRSYHLIATGSRDGHVRIWRVRPPTPSEDLEGESDDDEGKWSASIVGDFDDHKCVAFAYGLCARKELTQMGGQIYSREGGVEYYRVRLCL